MREKNFFSFLNVYKMSGNLENLLNLEGGKRRRGSKKASKKGSKKGSRKAMDGGKRRAGSKKASKKASKKGSKKGGRKH